MSSLKAQADALGIKVNGNWSDDTLKAKIAEAKSAQVNITPATNGGPSAEAASGAPVTDDGKTLKTEETPKAAKAKVTLDEKTLLIAKALELNIVVDEDWDEDRLRGEIQIAREGRADLQVKGAIPPKELSDPDYDPATKTDKTPGISIILERDYWVTQDDRRAAGDELVVSKAQAADLIAKGVAKRNDPL